MGGGLGEKGTAFSLEKDADPRLEGLRHSALEMDSV